MNTHKEYNIERLLFRRQFVLGPRFLEDFPHWSRVKINDKYFLTVHPDLEITRTVQDSKSITLLGFILDPDNEQYSNKDILDKLIRKIREQENLDSFIQHTYAMGGRWVLIIDNGKELIMFHDPMGLRQVFFTCRDNKPGIWCASQPGILAEILNLEMDKNAVNEFINSNLYKTWNECIWPGDSTPFKEIKQLLPNHYLNLNIHTSHRYWPDGNMNKLSIEHVVSENSRMLKALIRSASNRFDLAFTITSGWDSRLLLAASRELSHKIYYFSLLRKGSEQDVITPSRLLPKLGLKHHVISYPDNMDEEFKLIYKRNISESHDFWGRMAQGLYNFYPMDRVCVKGNASEIARVRFRVPDGVKVTSKILSEFSALTPLIQREMRENPFVNQAWEKWLSGIHDLYDIHLLDLFYWEHWGGNFAAMTQSEWDIIHEVFTPYNCRQLLINMLSVDEKYREHDDPILYKDLILKLWPEVLCEPVNPHQERKKIEKNQILRPMIKKMLMKMHMYDTTKKVLERYR
jgi:hypothetical protein